MLQLVISYFNINTFKYIALLMGFSDRDVTLMYILSCISFMIGSFVNSYVWEKFKEKITLLFTLVQMVFLQVLLLVSFQKQGLFLVLIIYMRFLLSILQMNQHLYTFGLFKEKGLVYTRFVQIGFFLADVLNFAEFNLLFGENRILLSAWFNTSLSVFTLYLYVKYVHRE